MKSLPSSLFLVVSALMQALGMYKYTNDTMTMTGEVFFPVLFALMAAYVAFKNRANTSRFGAVHLGILALAVITFVLTLVGSIGKIYYFYPSVIVYYVALALLVIDLAFRIAAMPKAEKKPRPVKKQRKVAARSANLVAKAQTSDSAQNTGE